MRYGVRAMAEECKDCGGNGYTGCVTEPFWCECTSRQPCYACDGFGPASFDVADKLCSDCYDCLTNVSRDEEGSDDE